MTTIPKLDTHGILDWNVLTAFEQMRHATFVFDPDKPGIVWANTAAVSLWRADSPAELLARDFSDMTDTSRARIRHTLEQNRRGLTVSEPWTVYPRDVPTPIQVTMTGIRHPDSQLLILIQAVPLASGLDPSLLRGVEALRYIETMITLFDEDGTVLMRNPAAVQAFGPVTDRPGAFMETFVDPDEARGILTRPEEFDGPVRRRTLQGRRWHHLHLRRVYDPATGRRVRLSHALDITQRRQTERQLQLARQVLEHVHEGVLVCDADNSVIYANPAFTRLTGYPEADVLGQNPSFLASGRHDTAFFQTLWEQVNSQGHWEGDIWNRRKDGGIYPMRLSISVVHDARGRVSHHIGLLTDISQRKSDEARMQYLATHDPLTGLANRVLFRERLEHVLRRARRYSAGAALLFVDLDGFKPVNDNLGHAIGDRLLQGVAGRFECCLRDSDILARVGGDEFVVLMEQVDSDQPLISTARRLIDILEPPFDLEGHSICVGASIGIAVYPQDGQDVNTLLHRADQAMYQVKQRGRGGFCFYSPG